jgi:Divergent InlB B-repeat domain
VRRLVLAATFAAALWVGLWLAPGALAGTWCGTGENIADLPDANTGPQFHVVYAIPSDGTDRFATVVNQISDDVTSIDTWWAGQDPTRILRFDTAVFPSCTAVDISFERLPSPASALSNTDASNAALAIAGGLNASPLAAAHGTDFKNYLVYYDGPPPQPNVVCGTGEGTFDQGEGLAVVWLGACPNDPTDAIAAHEALHALGALPAGAPHACPLGQGGPAHPCDSAQDVLYPYASGAPLSQLLLDAGHDDYYGHSGTWNDIQDSYFMHRLDLPQETLSIAFQGAGTVTSDQPGVVCTTTCATQWDQNALVRLNAAPAANARFLGWTGACSGLSVCDLTMASAESTVAVFGPTVVTVRATVSGKGKVVCTPACSTHVTAGNVLTMRAVPATGWRFKAWTGACKGKQLTCRLQPSYSAAAKATFTRKATR